MRPRSTLDQWRVLDAIVRLGSFERAARSLHMSQSSASYAVARLQEALGLALLEPDGRRACLSVAGEQLLQQVRPLLRSISVIEAQAELMVKGGTTELRLAVDSAYPDELLFPVLLAFQRKHPAVRLSLWQAIRLTAEAAHERQHADLGIVTQVTPRNPSEPLYDEELVAVAHVSHPLHKIGYPLRLQHLREYTLVQISDTEAEAPQPTWIEGCQTWTVNTIQAALSAVRHGACFGWLPWEVIRPLLIEGELKELPLLTGKRRVTHLFVSLRNDLPSNSPAFALQRELKHAHPAGSRPKTPTD